MKYFNKPHGQGAVLTLTLRNNFFIPSTYMGVVGKMEFLIQEAHLISRTTRKAVRFSYLGAEVTLSEATSLKQALAAWVGHVQQSTLQKHGSRWPRFLIDPKWFEWIQSHFDKDGARAIVLASRIAILLNHFCYRERKSLEQVLPKYWALVTYAVDRKTLDDTLTILEDCWKEDARGYHLHSWYKRTKNPLYDKFLLSVTEGNQVQIIQRA
jgi:hypothetical protein